MNITVLNQKSLKSYDFQNRLMKISKDLEKFNEVK